MGAFRTPPQAPGGGPRPTTIEEAVETAYRVCDDYVARGRAAAGGRVNGHDHGYGQHRGSGRGPGASYGYQGPTNGRANPWTAWTNGGPSDPMRMWTEAVNAWMAPLTAMMQSSWGMNPFAGAAGPFGPFARPGTRPGASADGWANPWQTHSNTWRPSAPAPAPDWEYVPDDDEPASESPASARPRVDVAVEASGDRSSRVSVVLDGGGASALRLGPLVNAERVELPAPDDALVLRDGVVSVHIAVPREQPIGHYSGAIFDADSGRPCGRVDVEIVATSSP